MFFLFFLLGFHFLTLKVQSEPENSLIGRRLSDLSLTLNRPISMGHSKGTV